MKVIVDTSVWSLALRRQEQSQSNNVQELQRLIQEHLVCMIGPIRQEILSGIRHGSQFKTLKTHLDAFPDIAIVTEDYVTAATFFNRCRSSGVQGSNTDFLICAVAVRNECAIFTTDKDFSSFAEHLPIILHQTASL